MVVWPSRVLMSSIHAFLDHASEISIVTIVNDDAKPVNSDFKQFKVVANESRFSPHAANF